MASGEATEAVIYQSLTYGLLLGALYLAGRYHQPFWRSLRWTGGYRGAWICVVAGPVLVFGTALLGAALREPVIPSPLQNLITDRLSLVVAMLFVTILGPVWGRTAVSRISLPVARQIARTLGRDSLDCGSLRASAWSSASLDLATGFDHRTGRGCVWLYKVQDRFDRRLSNCSRQL